MKLKKIASLMLAGIMAVSMLAGCKSGTPDPDNNGGASSNTTSSFTQSVLSKTNAKTKALLKAGDNAKIDAAVEYAAINDTSDTDWRAQVTDIEWAQNNWKSVALAETKMNGAEAGFRTADALNGIDVDANADMWKYDLPYTYWTVGCVSSTLSDDAIAGMVASLLDDLDYAVDSSDYTYDYEVRVAKSVCKNDDLASANDDYVIVGVALTCNREAVKY